MPPQQLNPYRDPIPWNRVRIAGLLIKSLLRKWDGATIKHEWKQQKSKEKSGEVNVFAGTKGLNGIKLTFWATNEAQFDDLYVIYEALKPVPGLGGGGSSTPKDAPTFAIGSPAAKGGTTTAPAGGLPAFGIPDPTAKTTKTTEPNPGPRPPTVPIELGVLKFLGVTAVALAEWDGPNPVNEGLGGWEVTITLVQDKPPTPAGAGAMTDPKPGSQFAGGGGTSNPQDNADAAKKRAAAAADGT